jgi:hypothetical protein
VLRRLKTSSISRLGPTYSMLSLEDMFGRGTASLKRSLRCQRFLMVSSTRTINPVDTMALLMLVSVSLARVVVNAHSATSAKPLVSFSSLIHKELGGTQPPLASSSAASCGVMGVGTTWALACVELFA